MRRCLDLAALAQGSVSPNPMVGAAIVHQGKLIAENYHRQYGHGHAEVLVINDVLTQYAVEAPAILQESTLYVTLEPCSHQGKTPPCADLIIKHGIPRVVIAMGDPSDKVNGRGIAKLIEAGVEVIVGVLEEEARWLNRRFVAQVQQHRPYIILKWAQTSDGFMAPVAQEKRWITGKESKMLVHRWRSEEDAILVGSGTALADNPSLTVREWEGRNPRRILIDKDLRVPASAAIFNEEAETLVFNEHKEDWQAGVKHFALENFGMYIPQQICYQLYLMDIQSLVVEGGIQTLDRFIQAGLWDEARVLESPAVWGSGRKAPQLHGKYIGNQAVGADKLHVYLHPDSKLEHSLRNARDTDNA